MSRFRESGLLGTCGGPSWDLRTGGSTFATPNNEGHEPLPIEGVRLEAGIPTPSYVAKRLGDGCSALRDEW